MPCFEFQSPSLVWGGFHSSAGYRGYCYRGYCSHSPAPSARVRVVAVIPIYRIYLKEYFNNQPELPAVSHKSEALLDPKLNCELNHCEMLGTRTIGTLHSSKQRSKCKSMAGKKPQTWFGTCQHCQCRMAAQELGSPWLCATPGAFRLLQNGNSYFVYTFEWPRLQAF